MKALLLRRVLVAIAALLLVPATSQAQEMVLNGGFEEGGDPWEIIDVAGSGNVPGVVRLSDSPDECPTDGSGNCLVLEAPAPYTNTVITQELTLIAGEPYTVDAQFRQLGEPLVDTWVEFFMSPVRPTEGQDYGPEGGARMSLNTWGNCANDVDGSFSANTCGGANDNTYVPPGTPGEEVIIFITVKAGTNNGEGAPLAIALDDFTVMGPGEAFAIAEFNWEPLYRVPVNYEISFDASASSGSADISSYEWNFGDGETATGATTTHTFTEEGYFDVVLTVTGEDGGVGTRTRTINVFEGTGSLVTPLEIPQADTAPVVDGEVDDVWADAQVIDIATRSSGTDPDSEEDLSGTVRILWDAEAIYGLFEVTDDDLQQNSTDTWQDDGVEFYIDAGNEKVFEGYDDNDVQYTMNWNSDVFTGNGSDRVEGASYVWANTEDGYRIEFVIPWVNVSFTPSVGAEIGIEAMINDDDDESAPDRDHKLGWYALLGVDNAHNQAHLFGTAVLVEEISTAAEPVAGVPGSFSIDSVYPNPFNPSTTAVLTLQQPGEYSVKVFDLLGRMVQEHTLHATAPGQMNVPITLFDQASGIYLISVEHSLTAARATTRVMLVK